MTASRYQSVAVSAMVDLRRRAGHGCGAVAGCGAPDAEHMGVETPGGQLDVVACAVPLEALSAEVVDELVAGVVGQSQRGPVDVDHGPVGAGGVEVDDHQHR